MTLVLPETFGTAWQGKKSAKTHKEEFFIANLLTNQLMDYDMKCDRVDNNPYSPYDLKVFEFNYETLTEGALVCKIDIEGKPGLFPKRKLPDHWYRGASFAERKMIKEINYERDVYLLFDTRPGYPRVIWAPYGTIREFGIPDDHSFRHRSDNPIRWKFRLIQDEGILSFSWHALVLWCNRLKNLEVTK